METNPKMYLPLSWQDINYSVDSLSFISTKGSFGPQMKEHLLDTVINSYWEKEQKENSYYGLTTEIIKKGAKIKT